MKTYDFYFASPFFNSKQVEREEALIKILRGFNFSVFSPKENVFLNSNASPGERTACFEDNKRAINSSRAVFAVTDEKDMGTIWEAGYAYGMGIPIIYFAETLNNGVFNLMLAESAIKVFTERRQLTKESLAKARAGFKEYYGGKIE